MARDLADFKARLPIVDVVQRYVRLTRHGPLHKGLCPFHQEKTPSFTVTDSRGTYHCFGCGAHGNALDFLMAIEGLGFAEAVRRAADLTGLEPPVSEAPDPQTDRRRALSALLEEANRRFRAGLRADDGAAARAYLARRGLAPAVIERFELGYAAGDRAALTRALEASGVARADLVDAGLTIVPEDGGAPYDRFRARLTFPIRDGRGRLVGFGGRALADDAKAKYLNSPEGPLFQKRELLYGAHGLDRRAGRGRLHVVEGYMDVIALAQHGIAAVAPLGTAMTEAQLERLWRLDDAPLVCLDGDAAGQAAAGRLAERALAVLGPGRSLAFALLPPGEDPDSLVRAGGAAAFARATAAPVPLAETLWRHVGADRGDAGPEARAEVRRRLRTLVRSIKDGDLRREYGREFQRRLGDRQGGRGDSWPPRAGTAQGGGQRLAAALARVEIERARALLGPLLQAPELLLRFDEEVSRLGFETGAYAQVRDALLDYLATDGTLETDAVLAHLRSVGLACPAQELAAGPTRMMPPGSTREELEEQYRMQLDQHERRRSQGAERDLAARASLAGGDDVSRHFESLNNLLNARANDIAGSE
jgi:DNA primase